ncbi:ABC transporter permease subunit [Neomegalonema sp.]|uniref:ABC transporter permease subunit n=1 Tax=Neomegalonema sp. TaxID=2039713 RepID=UPI002627D66E|nr:ABC transporter permease subunit [Neomegalonema sp.]MDD2869145.1 ABC transporter permease subunit [Neomegalonema sp.]
MRSGSFLLIAASLGFLFLYAPIVSLVVYSFNDSRLVTVWGGFTTKWYGELFKDVALVNAALVSLKVAVIAATLATILGTIAGFVLSRFGRFKGRLLFTGMVTAPLVMPEVITGLSLLLLFVGLEQATGWPAGRSATTIIIAHTTFCLAYVAVVVQSRLAGFDRSLEEAAMDLGARPLKVFFSVTLPIIAPALISGWLLAFTLSLDDAVIASFVSGPGSTTLPVEILSRVRRGVSPVINALATLIIVVVAVGFLIASLLMIRAERQRRRDEQKALAGK